MEYIIIIISAIFVNNIVFAQFLGICPFLGVSNKLSTSIGMGGAVIFVLTLATIVTYLVYQFVLVPLGLGFLQTISYILVIAALVQMVEIILKGKPVALPGAGYLPPADYHQLCRTGCGHSGYPEELQPA